jgi:hypothetical protein
VNEKIPGRAAGWGFNDDEPAPFGFSFEGHNFAAAHDKLSAIPGDDLWSRIGVMSVAFPVGHVNARDYVGRHSSGSWTWKNIVPRWLWFSKERLI